MSWLLFALSVLISPVLCKSFSVLLSFLVSIIPERDKNTPSHCCAAGYPLLVCSVDGLLQSVGRTAYILKWIFWLSAPLCFFLRSLMPWVMLPGAIALLYLVISKIRLLFTVISVSFKCPRDIGAPFLPFAISAHLVVTNIFNLYIFLSVMPLVTRI